MMVPRDHSPCAKHTVPRAVLYAVAVAVADADALMQVNQNMLKKGRLHPLKSTGPEAASDIGMTALHLSPPCSFWLHHTITL